MRVVVELEWRKLVQPLHGVFGLLFEFLLIISPIVSTFPPFMRQFFVVVLHEFNVIFLILIFDVPYVRRLLFPQ